MRTRLPLAFALLIIFIVLTAWAYQSAQLYVLRAGIAGSLKYQLLFNTKTMAVPVALLLGIFLGTMVSDSQETTQIVNGKIERHTELMFIQHWSHALGTVILIVSGLALGTLFIPRSLNSIVKVGFALNLHFVGILFFFFGASFYVTKGLLTGEINHMLPRKGDLKGSMGHYKAMLLGGEAPQEEKFLAVERVIFPFWIFGVSGITLSGAIKLIAHIWSMPGLLMSVVTFLHGFFAIYMALLLVAHVFAAAILPASWPLIRSMVTGYMSEEYVKHHHVLWYKQIQTENTKKEAKDSSQDANLEVASTTAD